VKKSSAAKRASVAYRKDAAAAVGMLQLQLSVAVATFGPATAGSELHWALQ